MPLDKRLREGPIQEMTLTRAIDAPRAMVFKAWIEPKQLAQWWGSAGFTNPVCELDVRPGGAMLIHMRGPDGIVYPMKGAFREIDEPNRLVFTAVVEDQAGNVVLENLNTVTFAEQNKKTTITLHVKVLKSTDAAIPMLAGMKAGWTQSLERLAKHVA